MSIRDIFDIVKTVWISLRDGVDIVIGHSVDIVKRWCGYR